MQRNAGHTHLILSLGVGAMLGLCAPWLLFAQQPAPLEPKKGAIDGSIINSQSGEPLQSAEVTLMRQDPTPMVIFGGGPKPPETMWRTTTDRRGKYKFPDLEPGRYTLGARKSGYGTRERTVYGARILLSAGEMATGVKIELTPQRSISGRVVDAEGKPVPHVGVAVLQEQYISGREQLYPINAFQTNERGEFQFAGVWTGPVVLQFMPWRLWRATPTGVTDAAPNMAYFTTYYPGTADVSQAARIEVSPGIQRAGLEGRLLKARVSRIRGWVRDHTGQSAMNCSVVLMPTNPAWGTLLMAHMTKAPDGSFEFQYVHPGSYRLIVELEDRTKVHRELITLGSQNIDNLDVRLPAPVQVEGEILVKGDEKVDPNLVLVSLHVDEEGVGHSPLLRRTTTDGGKFVFDNVLPGKYRITASLVNTPSPSESVYVEPVQYGDQEVTDAPVEIAAHPSRIRVTINSGAGSLTGIVMKKNVSARGAMVLLLSADRLRRLDQRWPRSAWNDENAHFTIEHIPPGDYLAFAFEETEEGFWRDAERFKKFESGAKKISIGKHGSTNVSLEITPLPEG